MNLSSILHKINTNAIPSISEIIYLLELQGDDLIKLYEYADTVRANYVGNDIFLRGIIEFSNYCKKDCFYCGIRRSHTDQHRYRMPIEEIIETCIKIQNSQQTTVVLQSGEDPFYTKELIGKIIIKIKSKTNLAITLSVGEHDKRTYQYWQDCGMDRYLLRFETSQPILFRQSHPDDDLKHRINCIRTLKSIGVQTGSGFLIGLPNETLRDLAQDIIFCTSLDLDMIGIGPFIPHEKTPFKTSPNPFPKEVYFKVISIIRALNKKAHIPSTTAFDAIDPNGRNLLLQRGANVFMPNATPQKYRKDYLLYPGKPCVDESSDDCSDCVLMRVQSLGRKIGKGPGHSLKP